MALYSCKASVFSRGTGRQAVAAAAYRSAEKLVDERYGVERDYTQKRGVLHSEIVAPENAPSWAHDRAALWNAAERRETGHAKQDSAAIAREFRLALPHELDADARLDLTRRFAKTLVVRYGVAVDFSLHAPDWKGDARNYHAHMMFTTRVMTAEGLGAKTRILDDLRKGPKEIAALRQLWAEQGAAKLADAGFTAEAERYRHGHKTLAEQRAAAIERGDLEHAEALDREATIHLGPNASAMERKGATTSLGDVNREIAARNASRADLREEAREVSAQIVDLDAERAKREGAKELRREAKTLEPERILESLTARRATFTRADLNRALKDVLPDPKARASFTDAVLTREDVIPLREHESAPVSRYTLANVIDHENQTTAAARDMAGRSRHGVTASAVAEALDAHSHLDPEQRAAFAHATSAKGFAMIAGEAGTGKSATLAAIRDAYEADGYRVQGLAWTNSVVQDLRAEGFDPAATISAELFRQNSGRGKWDGRTVLLIDEAAMLATSHLTAVMRTASAAGAKVILAGDDAQLRSVERGGLFPVLRAEHGAAELHTVRRVRDDEQKAAFNAMHRGDFREALGIFDKRGAIRWAKDGDQARADLVAAWLADNASAPEKTRFAFAYTNAEADALNSAIREGRKARGELGDDHNLQTKAGPQSFAAGDRVQFTANARDQKRRAEGLYNGAVGTLTAIEGDRVTVAIDTPKGKPARKISFRVGANESAGEFDGLRLGYAGTIYKGQGKTLDRSFVLHSDQWRAATGYVALSRHRESVQIFAAEKPAPWVAASGGLDGLTAQQRESAERSFAAWAEAKPTLAARYGLASYVAYVQEQAAEQARYSPLDRMAVQIGRKDENRAATSYIRADQPTRPDLKTRGAEPAERKPPLSIVAAIVNNYIDTCYDPAKDWLRWIAEDLKHRAAERRERSATREAEKDAVHVAGPRPALDTGERIREKPLPEVQGGLDADRRERKNADGLPVGPGADPSRNDGLRPLRADIDPAPPRNADDRLRDRLDEIERRAEREITRREEEQGPTKASDYLRSRGRFRSRGRER